MKENVGRTDQAIRSIVGPAMMTFGYRSLGANTGRLPGLGVLIAGALLLESAITRVCPINGLIGLDTRSRQEKAEDAKHLQDPQFRQFPL